MVEFISIQCWLIEFAESWPKKFLDGLKHRVSVKTLHGYDLQNKLKKRVFCRLDDKQKKLTALEGVTEVIQVEVVEAPIPA